MDNNGIFTISNWWKPDFFHQRVENWGRHPILVLLEVCFLDSRGNFHEEICGNVWISFILKEKYVSVYIDVKFNQICKKKALKCLISFTLEFEGFFSMDPDGFAYIDGSSSLFPSKCSFFRSFLLLFSPQLEKMIRFDLRTYFSNGKKSTIRRKQ